MIFEDNPNTYTTEHIIAHTTDGWCHGKRKYDTGFCDEAIRRT